MLTPLVAPTYAPVQTTVRKFNFDNAQVIIGGVVFSVSLVLEWCWRL